jgi:hypothetical protein
VLSSKKDQDLQRVTFGVSYNFAAQSSVVTARN